MNIMSSLLLQKPSKISKTKDHISAFDIRLTLWEEGKFGNLFCEAKTIQNSLKTTFNSCLDIKTICRLDAKRLCKWYLNYKQYVGRVHVLYLNE